MIEPGLQFGDRFVPHAEFLGRVARAATGFRSLGIGSEDSVALMLRNDVAYLEATLGVRTVGGFPVPMNWHLKSEEINYILKDSDAKILVIHSDLLREVSEAVPEGVKVLEVRTPQLLVERYGVTNGGASGLASAVDWDSWVDSHKPWSQAPDGETSSMIYTSGTTGKPKGVRRETATPEQYQQLLKVVARVLGLPRKKPLAGAILRIECLDEEEAGSDREAWDAQRNVRSRWVAMSPVARPTACGTMASRTWAADSIAASLTKTEGGTLCVNRCAIKAAATTSTPPRKARTTRTMGIPLTRLASSRPLPGARQGLPPRRAPTPG